MYLSSGRPDAELFRISYGYGIPSLLAGEGIVYPSTHIHSICMYVHMYLYLVKDHVYHIPQVVYILYIGDLCYRLMWL